MKNLGHAHTRVLSNARKKADGWWNERSKEMQKNINLAQTFTCFCLGPENCQNNMCEIRKKYLQNTGAVNDLQTK